MQSKQALKSIRRSRHKFVQINLTIIPQYLVVFVFLVFNQLIERIHFEKVYWITYLPFSFIQSELIFLLCNKFICSYTKGLTIII